MSSFARRFPCGLNNRRHYTKSFRFLNSHYFWATAFLVDLISSDQVTCTGDTRERYKRLIAVCYVDDIDLNAALVRAGWAVAYRHYSMDYVDEEEAAEFEGAGMWRGTFEMPWEWRRAH